MMILKRFFYSYAVLGLGIWGLSLPAHALSLKEILQNALSQDPALLEARANELSAKADIEVAKSQHYPTVTLVSSQMLAQKRRNDFDRDSKTNIGLQGKLNLYSWGGIESQVRQNEQKHQYFAYKYDETREEVSNKISELYLDALRAQESIEAAKNNMQRHNQIINDLTIITKFDRGRMSELDQAYARRLRVDAFMAEQERVLALNLSRLEKYTQTPISGNALTDPFANEIATSLVKRFQLENVRKQPSYQAQQAEYHSVAAELDTQKAMRKPQINLIANVNRDNQEVYLNLEWDMYNRGRQYGLDKNAQALAAAQAKMDEIERDVSERARSAQVDMQQSLRRLEVAEQQIAAQKKVIKAYELQFKIARRTLIDVLDAYAELWSVEQSAIAARNDFRDAALAYLYSQAALVRWASL